MYKMPWMLYWLSSNSSTSAIKIYYNFRGAYSFSLSYNVYVQDIETQKVFLRKCLESVDTGIVKKLRKFLY